MKSVLLQPTFTGAGPPVRSAPLDRLPYIDASSDENTARMVENVGLDINDPSRCVSRLISIHFSFSSFNLFPLPLCDQNKKKLGDVCISFIC